LREGDSHAVNTIVRCGRAGTRGEACATGAS
jgi:hypothetical protein